MKDDSRSPTGAPSAPKRPLWRTLLYGLIGLVVLLVAVSYLLPAQIHVERSILIKAPAEKVFARVNHLKNWEAWSPWHAMEPDAKYVYSGPEEGANAKASWEGKKIGTGSQTITRSEPFQRIESSLDMGSQGKAEGSFTFDETNGETKVVWAFDTNMGMNPIARYMGLMMDRWIGADFEKGLNSLKELCEKS
jgi:hypothetical protein